MSSHASPVHSALQRRLIASLIALLLAFLCFLAGEWTLEFFFGYNPDSIARDAEARSNPAIPSSDIVLVTITDSDYATFFGGRSPLRADTLDRIIRVIAAARPRVVGIDLDTSDPSFGQLAPLAESFAQSREPRVVWAQDMAGCPAVGDEQGANATSESKACRDHGMTPLGVLGISDDSLQKRNRAEKGNIIETGLAVTQLDEYGTVRRYQRSLEIGAGERLSFAAAIRRALGTAADDDNDQKPRYVRFHPGLSTEWRLSIQQLLNHFAKQPTALATILTGKIVLLGGTFRAARDDHHTPVGMMAGVDIHAQTIDTELNARVKPAPGWLRLSFLRFLFGIALALPFIFLPLRAGLLCALPISVACCLLGSWMTTGQGLAGVGYFLPFLALVVIFSLYERASHIQHEFYLEFKRRIGNHEPDEENAAGPVVDYVASAVAAAEAAVVSRAQSGLATITRSVRPRPEPQSDAVSGDAAAGAVKVESAIPARRSPNEPAKPGTQS